MKQERTIEINNLFKNIQTAEDKKEFISDAVKDILFFIMNNNEITNESLDKISYKDIEETFNFIENAYDNDDQLRRINELCKIDKLINIVENTNSTVVPSSILMF